MPGSSQRILVVSAAASETELRRLRRDLGRRPLVLAAPTTEARRVVDTLGAEPTVELLLAPARFPTADRGHQLDALVRRHALVDRFRDVVVVTDLATSTLLLRVLAPDQLRPSGAVTVVGLPRADRTTAVRRGVAGGAALGVVSGLGESVVPILTLPAVVALAGLVLLLLPPWRHLGRELLLAAAVSIAVLLVVATSSTRFPGSW